jgi:cytochrome c peroxidase
MHDPLWRGRRLAIAAVPIGALVLVAVGCGQPATREESAASGGPPQGLEYVPPAPGTYELPVIQQATDGAVLDTAGHQRRLFDYLEGRYSLLSFIYSRCSDGRGCPFATATLRMVLRRIQADPDLAGEVRLVTLSFDPERDTPESLDRFARSGGLSAGCDDDPWAVLTTASQVELQPILDGYGQYIVPEIDAEGRLTGDFTHVLKVYLIDRRRRVRNIYSSSYLHPALVINDIKTLLMSEAAGGGELSG